MNGNTKTLILIPASSVGPNGEKVTWTESADHLTWHWHITGIDTSAKDFRIKEDNYNKENFALLFAINGVQVNDPSEFTGPIPVAVPTISLEKRTDAEVINPDNNKQFKVVEGDILLVSLTSTEGTAILSQKSLSYGVRQAIINYMPKINPGNFKKPAYFLSKEEHPEGYIFQNQSHNHNDVGFGFDGEWVEVEHDQSNHVAVFTIKFENNTTTNSYTLVNDYSQKPIDFEIIKVDEENGNKKLSGAKFTVEELNDTSTLNNISKTIGGTVINHTTNSEGYVKFTVGHEGYYRITETKCPDGYIMNEDTTIFMKLYDGIISFLKKPDDGSLPITEWKETTDQGEGTVRFTAAVAGDADTGTEAASASFTVKNKAGAQLPSTGGLTSIPFIALGTVLTVSATAGALLELRKRRREDS